MPSDRASLVALRDLIADTDLTLETIPDLPQNPRLSPQNRPYVITSKPANEPHSGQEDVVPCRRLVRQVFFLLDAIPRDPQGDRARGISAERFEIPLAGGGASFAPWGEPSPPRLSPGGNGKGGSDSLLPQANFLLVRCFMMLLEIGWCLAATARHYFRRQLLQIWCANCVDRI